MGTLKDRKGEVPRPDREESLVKHMGIPLEFSCSSPPPVVGTMLGFLLRPPYLTGLLRNDEDFPG